MAQRTSSARGADASRGGAMVLSLARLGSLDENGNASCVRSERWSWL